MKNKLEYRFRIDMTDLSVTDYSEKAIVVRGDTREHKDDLKQLGGSWNARLRDGPGWIFSKKAEARVLSYISTGKIDSSSAYKSSYSRPKAEIVPKSDAPPARAGSTESVLLGVLSKLSALQSEVEQLLQTLRAKKLAKKGKSPAVIKKPARTVVETSDAEEDEEKVGPRKRLLSKK